MCITLENKKLDQEDYRNELRKSIEATHERLVNAVTLFNSKKAIEPINADQLRKFP